jgi:DNA sulfur modification protein DndC
MHSKKTIFFKRLEKILEETKTKKFIVAFSGGKDSTVLLHLTLDFCISRKIPITILHGDTFVENPLIREYCNNFLEKLIEWKEKRNINLKLLIATPKLDSTFWVNLIGKGYPMPNFKFRWCQKYLKIQPAKNLLKAEGGVLLVGMRLNESQERKRSLRKRLKGLELENNGVRVFAPIYDWEDKDIWNFLIENTPPWGGSYQQLIKLYKKARGDCPLIPDTAFKATGCGMRFGCWVCSVVREDKTAKNLATENEKLKKLVRFRNWLIDFSSKEENRFGFSRKGKFLGKGKGMLTRKAREKILINLLKLQKNIEMELIKPEELKIIKQLWFEESQKFCAINPKENFDFSKLENLFNFS